MTLDLTLEDRLAIYELAARYGNVIDARDWDRLSQVFSEDATFVMEGFDQSDRYNGLNAIREMMVGGRHPVAHHVTNIEIDSVDDRVTLFFKVLGPGPGGRVGSADYHDELRKEPAGWRIAVHRVTLRRPESRSESG